MSRPVLLVDVSNEDWPVFAIDVPDGAVVFGYPSRKLIVSTDYSIILWLYADGALKE